MQVPFFWVSTPQVKSHGTFKNLYKKVEEQPEKVQEAIAILDKVRRY